MAVVESVDESNKKKKQRKRTTGKSIKFEEEIVTKDVAQEILSRDKAEKKHKRKKRKANEDVTNNEQDEEEHKSKKSKKKPAPEEQQDIEAIVPKVKKRKKQNISNEDDESSAKQENEEENNTEDKSKKKMSIREQKRQKHAQLLKDQKLKTELGMQQKCLNYLSKWKHSRSDWKFEKLRQIWLQQNMYDEAKVPNEFWNTLLEYLNNSKGKARILILKEAVKIIEQENEEDQEESIKVKRAREIVQNLEE